MEKVLVLMSSYNGEKYIREQIESILNQKGVNVSILVRDDGSSDRTTAILDEYKANGKLDWYGGANLKPARSFMDLLKKATTCSYYAFADQDDYWLENKLKIAVDSLRGDSRPSLYYGRPILVDAHLNRYKNQQRIYETKTLAASFITSNATGCTFVFNHALREAVNKCEPTFMIMHDGWIAKVCRAVQGIVFYDENVPIYYRQHGNNVVGGKTSFRKRWKRRIKSLFSKSRKRSRIARELVDYYGNSMSQKDLADMKLASEYHESLKGRMKLAFNKSFRTNSFLINCSFVASVILGSF